MHQIQAMLAQGRQILAICLTAYAGYTNEQQVIAPRLQRHLAKPVEPQALIEAIAQVTQRHI